MATEGRVGMRAQQSAREGEVCAVTDKRCHSNDLSTHYYYY